VVETGSAQRREAAQEGVDHATGNGLPGHERTTFVR
jgi:hypothetical protein